jgi:hypothetical protein
MMLILADGLQLFTVLRRRLTSRFERLSVEAPPWRFKPPGRLKNHGGEIKLKIQSSMFYGTLK